MLAAVQTLQIGVYSGYGAAILITLVGDGDRIVINGAALNVGDITIPDNPVRFDFI